MPASPDRSGRRQSTPGKAVGLPIDLPPRTDAQFRMSIGVPKTARSGDTIALDVVQQDVHGKVIGGIRVKINVR